MAKNYKVKVTYGTSTPGRVQPPADGSRVKQQDDQRPEEFRQFEAMTRKLVKVPKKELDEKRKDEA